MDSENWFLKKEQQGKIYGPLTDEQLQEYWQAGKISAKMLLSSDQQKWYLVEQIMQEQVKTRRMTRAFRNTTSYAQKPDSSSSEAKTLIQPSSLPSIVSPLSRYTIIKELGRGGMGVVYQVMDTNLNQIVAVKMLLDKNMDSINLKRFMREAEISANLSHPNIVQVYGFGTTPQVYISMEYIEGRSFHELLANKDYPLRSKLEILQQVCDAVHYGHQKKIVHRDLKPQNIMVTRDNIAKVMDFGLAKNLSMQSLKLSKTGQFMGTPQYMSPEQADGRKLDHRSDIYSLGIILYQILTGRTPYDSDNIINILDQLAYNKPTLPQELNPEVPKDLQMVCMKCLKKNPQDRYASAKLLRDDIHAYLENRPIAISKNKTIKRTKQWMQRNQMIAGVLVTLALGILFLIAGMAKEQYEQAQWSHLNAAGFTFLREATYTCNGITNTVKEYRHNSTGMEFVLIPGGTFTMGSSHGDSDEKIVRVVTLSPYLISKTEVTQGIWKKVMGNHPSYFKKGDSYPVEQISWDECQIFCKKTGLQLPSEPQWEYAARGGSTTKYYFGDFPDQAGNYSWYGDNAGRTTHPVAQKFPNAYGIYDMCGNVYEWCQNWYSHSYKQSSPTIDPLGPSSGYAHVCRGGSWNTSADYLRSANRNWFMFSSSHLGFRVCWSKP